MADLGGFDATQVEPQGEYLPVKPGDYQMVINESERKATKAGDGFYIGLKLEITDGENKGRTFFDNLNIENKNPQAVEIAYKTLSSICHAVGVMKPKDSDELHFKPMLVKVGLDPKSAEPRNVIKGYKALDGSTPVATTTAPAATATPATKAKAPWEK